MYAIFLYICLTNNKTPMKTRIIILSSLVLLISSCAMQKRHYRKGYYLDFKDSKSTVSINAPKNHKTAVEVKSEPVEAVKQIEMPKQDIAVVNQPEEKPLVASIKPVKEIKEHKKLTISSEQKSLLKMPVIKPERGKDNSGLYTLRALLITFGIILTFAGAALAWSVSVFFILVALLGLAMWITGGVINSKLKKARKQNNPNNNSYSEYQDVVYLKNGSIIRGMIIEQIPGVSLKLETRDGNVFVYKMEEIEKMTKEKTIK